MAELSPRLRAVLEALPLRPGLRVLELGCGPGPLARAIAERVAPDGYVLGVDRSTIAIQSAERQSDVGALDFRVGAADRFVLEHDQQPFDLLVANRLGALDGRQPELEPATLERLRAATVPGASLFIDQGDPLKEIALH